MSSWNNLEAYHGIKSTSSISDRIARFRIYESGSFLTPAVVKGISFTVTLKPNAIVVCAFLITDFIPVPINSPLFGGSASGIKHRFVECRFNCENWFSVQADPSEAITLFTPIDCRRNTSGAPSTR